ncbi:unnamed protein product [Amoebophrya sp. A120]|nr:unnamed protein product [Amoebophrya sp. A120]|eukprot:GSA120T00015713001.1
MKRSSTSSNHSRGSSPGGPRRNNLLAAAVGAGRSSGDGADENADIDGAPGGAAASSSSSSRRLFPRPRISVPENDGENHEYLPPVADDDDQQADDINDGGLLLCLTAGSSGTSSASSFTYSGTSTDEERVSAAPPPTPKKPQEQKYTEAVLSWISLLFLIAINYETLRINEKQMYAPLINDMVTELYNLESSSLDLLRDFRSKNLQEDLRLLKHNQIMLRTAASFSTSAAEDNLYADSGSAVGGGAADHGGTTNTKLQNDRDREKEKKEHLLISSPAVYYGLRYVELRILPNSLISSSTHNWITTASYANPAYNTQSSSYSSASQLQPVLSPQPPQLDQGVLLHHARRSLSQFMLQMELYFRFSLLPEQFFTVLFEKVHPEFLPEFVELLEPLETYHRLLDKRDLNTVFAWIRRKVELGEVEEKSALPKTYSEAAFTIEKIKPHLMLHLLK